MSDAHSVAPSGTAGARAPGDDPIERRLAERKARGDALMAEIAADMRRQAAAAVNLIVKQRARVPAEYTGSLTDDALASEIATVIRARPDIIRRAERYASLREQIEIGARSGAPVAPAGPHRPPVEPVGVPFQIGAAPGAAPSSVSAQPAIQRLATASIREEIAHERS